MTNVSSHGGQREHQGAERMTAADRRELIALLKLTDKCAKEDVDRVAAERVAEFEEQIAKQYKIDDSRWAEATRRAEEEVAAANQRRVRAVCRELGVPAEFAPELDLRWWGRGENGFAKRRDELRKVAQTRAAADAKAAKAEISRATVAAQTALLAVGLTTDAAREHLLALPKPEALMPHFDVGENANGRLEVRRRRALPGGES